MKEKKNSLLLKNIRNDKKNNKKIGDKKIIEIADQSKIIEYLFANKEDF